MQFMKDRLCLDLQLFDVLYFKIKCIGTVNN